MRKLVGEDIEWITEEQKAKAAQREFLRKAGLFDDDNV